MGNCLITKLKSSVNNNRLPILGSEVYNLTPTTEIGHFLGLRAKSINEPIILDAVDGVLVVNGTESQTVTINNSISIVNVDVKNCSCVILKNKENVLELTRRTYDEGITLKSLQYFTNLQFLNFWCSSTTKSNEFGLLPLSLTSCIFQAAQCEWNIEDSKHLKNVSYLDLSSSLNFKGDFASWASSHVNGNLIIDKIYSQLLYCNGTKLYDVMDSNRRVVLNFNNGVVSIVEN